MSNYRGITIGFVIAKLFAMILEQRIASWAEEHAVKAKGQAGCTTTCLPLGFTGMLYGRKDYRTTDNISTLWSLVDKRRQSRQKGKAGKL